MEERKLKKRTIAMGILFLAGVVVCVMNLLNLQVVNGQTYYEQSSRAVVTTSYTTVNASRGEVFDRNGVPLITNHTVYSLGFMDITRESDETINSAIIKLFELCSHYGVKYEDTLPIDSFSNTYLETDTLSQERFDSFKAHFGWPQELTAPQTIEKMRSLYGLEDSELDKSLLRQIIGVRYEITLRNILNISSYTFAKDVPTTMVAAIEENGLQLVNIKADTERVYNTEYAAHILGYVGPMDAKDYERFGPLGYDMDEIVGKSGIELAFEEYLHGTRGILRTRRNAQGEIISQEYVTKPQAGKDVYLTLDMNLQAAAENSLETCITDLRTSAEEGKGREAKGGAVVAIDVNTFEVLAIASYPTFDINTYREDTSLFEDEMAPLLNRATQGLYEPGSTFKMVTAIAALESGAIELDTHIEDRGIYEYYAPSYTPACWIHTSRGITHGIVNVSQALMVSCNYFFYESARLTGIETMNEYSKAFGLGEKTGIEVYEETGILAGPAYRESKGSTWTAGDTIQAGIGQSDNIFTPMQLASYIASLANGGRRYSAHLMKLAMSSSSDEEAVTYENKLLGNIEISDEVYKAVMEGMLEASESGTAASVFANYPVKVASKTGSAQTGLSSDNAVFVCCAPYDEPEIAVVVIVEQGGQGGLIGSVAKDVLDQHFFGASSSEAGADNTLVE